MLTLGFGLGLLELFVYLKQRSERFALWAGVVAIGAGSYSTCMAFLYQAEPGPTARFTNQLLYLAVVLTTHSTVLTAASLTNRPQARLWPWLAVSALTWTVAVMATPWVVGTSFTEVPLSLSEQPFPQHQASIMTAIFLVYHVGVAATGCIWLILSPVRRVHLLFIFAFGVWVFAGFVDSAVVLRVFHHSPTFFSEYGMVAMALALGVRTVVQYTSALEAQQRSFDAVLERAPVAVVLHRDGRFIYVNQAAADFVGYSSEELIGIPTTRVLHIEGHARAAQRIEEAARGEVVPSAREIMVRKDGSRRRVELTTLGVQIGDSPAVLTLVRDLEEQERLRAKAMELDRMVAVGSLAAGVAHEINNPLTYLLGSIEHVIEELDAEPEPEPEALKEVLAEAKLGAVRIQRIVGELSNLARKEDAELGPTDATELMDAMVRLTMNELRHRATVVKEYDAIGPVLADEGRLSQVLTNLLVNAAHSIPAGHVSEHRVTVRIREDDGRASLEVEDTGEGIDAELLPNIFDPFVTTKGPGEGTGLGLAISRQLVENMEGEIVVSSEPGRGSLFRVILPLATERAIEAVRKSTPATREVPSARVLLIDDEVLVLRALTRALSRKHEVTTKGSVAEAAALLEEDRAFELILCDFMMPNQTGQDLYEIVEERWPELLPRLVFMTGGVFSSEGRTFMEEKSLTVLPKPLDLSDVEEVLSGRFG